MFDNLTERLNRTLKNLSGKGRITEDNIKDTLREVRTALLEADVALPVVKTFCNRVKEAALGKEVALSLTPGQEFIQIVYNELTATMGGTVSEINLATQPPAVVLLAGLQGAGKTTSAAKLALYLKERLKKKVLMVSVDTYRPAAIEQLLTLGEQVGVDTFPSDPALKPQVIATAALEEARKRYYDVLIVDTAGRLAVDEAMMQEVRELSAILNPVETMFVVDAMTGQDAANTAKAFADALTLTGVILTKADGDARGGAALSVREVTGCPIKFIGMGEKVEALEPFFPDRIASRILDMGDLLSLIEQLQRGTDTEKAAKMAEKLKKGEGFTLEDFADQLRDMRNMGGMSSLLDKLPGMSGMADKIKEKVNDKEISHIEAIISSMTPKERRKPEIIKGSRKKRIAAGAGVSIQEVNRLLKQFEEARYMMRRMGKGGMKKMMGAMKGMMGMGGMGGLGGLMGGMGGGFPMAGRGGRRR
ncbi:MAG TPA: signal recognition particle protein [Candidatus Avisuccinivibrio pullicola]|nr:signal recognition particle protein [Candidatus Avisuccinivibrio pullicola]